MNNKSAIQQYTRSSRQADVAAASPHRLIQMLMEGALEKIAIAKGHMDRKEIAEKGKAISWAIDILDGLRMSLDHEAGGELAANLDSLYDYMSLCLLEANKENSQEKLDEAGRLLRSIKSAWDAIAEDPAVQSMSTGDTTIVSASVR